MANNTVADAYVQIIPSAKGIKGSITKALGGESDAAGKFAGESIGSQLIGKLKGVIATAAIGKFIGDSISVGADFQQSLGGVETIFKDSADKMKEYAAEAYKTAGVSANDYMENVTSFSASLLSSLGGDTNKAADYANRAMIDMSDNANKMGTNIGDIQNAYQGFAKQNYTMLDNLKLGYGGTQEEMKRLIQDASQMTDVQEELGITVDSSSMSFGNIVNAISVMQKSMDIAGTTTKEAATTISGSKGMMVAAFDDLRAHLVLGDDVTQQIQNLSDSVLAFADNVIPAIGNVVAGAIPAGLQVIAQAIPTSLKFAGNFVKQVGQKIVSSLPKILMSLRTGMAEISKFMYQNLPDILDSITHTLSQIAPQITKYLPTILRMAIDAIGQFANAILSEAPQILQAVLDIIVAVGQSIITNIPLIVSRLGQLITNMVTFFAQAVPQIVQTGVMLFTALVQNIPAIIQAITEALPTLIQGICDGITVLLPAIAEAGVQLFAAIVQNLPAIIEAIVAAIPQIWTAIVTSFTEMDWSGLGQVFIDAWEAIKQTWTDGWQAIYDACPGWVQNIFDGISTAWGAISDFFTGAWDTISGAAQTAWDTITGIFSGDISLKDIATTAWDNAVTAAQTAWNSIKGFFEGAAPVVQSIATGAWDTLTSTAQSIWDGAKGIFEGVGPKAAAIVTDAWDGITGIAQDIWDDIGDIFGSFDITWPDFGELAKSAFEGLKTAAQGAWNWVKGLFGGKEDPVDTSGVDDAVQEIQGKTGEMEKVVTDTTLRISEVDTTAIQRADTFVLNTMRRIKATVGERTTLKLSKVNTASLDTARKAAISAAKSIMSAINTMSLRIPSIGTSAISAAERSIERLKSKIRSIRDTVGQIRIKVPNLSVDMVKHGSGNSEVSVPSIRNSGYSWYDKGGIFTRPATIGVAERRPEFVGALDDLRKIVREETGRSAPGYPVTVNLTVNTSANVNEAMLSDMIIRKMDLALGGMV